MRKWVALLMLMISQLSFAAMNVVTQDKPTVIVSRDNAEFVIQLKSNPTTGYSWFLRSYDSNLLEPVSHAFVAPANKKLMGAPGMEAWTFKAKPAALTVPQETSIRFIYTRPWNQNDNATQATFNVISQVK